jgi:hypothetical protein
MKMKWGLVLGIVIAAIPLQIRAEDKPAQTETKTTEKTEKKTPSWFDNIKIMGDFRYRHEMIDEQDKDTRNRHRMRARLGFDAAVNSDTNVIFQLASGSDDPVSTNQSITGSFTHKAIWIDMAYFDWHPASFKGFRFQGGKVKNPFICVGKSELIWDADLNQEGLALKYSAAGKRVEFMANAGGFWIEERKDTKDSMLYAGQAGLKFKLNGDDLTFTLGGSYYGFNNVKDFGPFYDPEKKFVFYGNTATETNVYAYEYKLMEVFAPVCFANQVILSGLNRQHKH